MAKKSKLAVFAEYGALRAFCAIVNAIPYGAAMAAARGLAWTAFSVFGLHRRRTMERLRGVFPKRPEAELKGIAVASLSNLLQTGVEMMRSPRLTREWMDRYV